MQSKERTLFLKKKTLWIIIIIILMPVLGLYYYFTILANSFWLDQYKLIEYSKEILDGNFRLVGMRTSRLNWNFPMIHYLLTPLIAFSSKVWVLYLSAAVSYVIGVLSLSWILFKYRPFSEFFIYILLSITHVWSMFFSSFAWPPNYIPFFASLFLVCVFKYIYNSKKIFFFHIASILLNIIFQLHPMSFTLIIGFFLALFFLGKLPRYVHWIIQIIIQISLLLPWLIFHLFIIDWDKEPDYHSSLFKNFLSPVIEFFNYLSGIGLTREFTQYLNYGTNTFPLEKFWFNFLFLGGLFFLILIIWSFWNIQKLNYRNKRNWKNFLYKFFPYHSEEKRINFAYPLAIYYLCLPTLLYFVSGISMASHYYEFLTPLIFLILSILPGQIKKVFKRKIAWLCILSIICIQGIFSYWRAFEEYRSPYLNDIGYTKVLANILASECTDNPQIRFVTENGFRPVGQMFNYRFLPILEHIKKKGTLNCQSILVFQNKLFEMSPVLNWYFKNLNPEMKIETHNNQIWIMGNKK